MKKIATLLGVVMGLVGSVAACGGDDGSTFPGARTESGSGEGQGAFGGGAADGGGGSGLQGRAACVTAVAEGNALPAHLVFMYDKSGSMRDDAKWTTCGAAMTSFFADNATSGLEASLAFFSHNDSCDVSLYATPSVAMRTLPDATSFKSAIDAVIEPGGKTPTLPAMKGAIQYAHQVEQSLAGAGRVAIVLVTDGEPNGCGSTPENVAAEAAKIAGTIPTYVIGVGDALQNLDTIAAGGGTGKAIVVSTADPTKVTTELSTALGKVKTAVGCAYAVPAAPAGQTLDYRAVNVVYTPSGAAPITLEYSADCANPNGWHYDDVNAPKRIVMCGGSCQTLTEQAATARVEIELGCATQGTLPR